MRNGEVIEVIENLNQSLFDKYGETEFDFSYSSNGYWEAIAINGFTLWISDCDDRDFNEVTNEYEPLEPFIINKWNTLVKKLYGMQL